MNTCVPVSPCSETSQEDLASSLVSQGVWVSEKRSSVELEQLAAGRSINLALAERGRFALECAGALTEQGTGGGQSIVDAVLAQAIAMPGRQVHMPDGSENFQSYSAAGDQAIYSVHRARLNRTLLTSAKNAGAELAFDERVLSVDLAAKTAQVERAGQHYTVAFELIIGADGAGSVLREAIAARADSAHAAPHVEFLDHGYKEIAIPAARAPGQGPDQTHDAFALTPGALHIWPRERFMVIALPNPDCTFTATLFLPNTGLLSFAALDAQPENTLAFFRDYFPELITLVPDLMQQMAHNPKGMLGTLHCQSWVEGAHAVILGDAAHAIVPFHGQGMNCAFEDCVLLAQLLATDTPRAVALAQFAAQRRPQARAIAEMALENYVEMRDHVADDDFRLRKALEQTLARLHPGHFVPRYELVSFSRVDYALAQARGGWQSALLHEFCDGKHALADIDVAGASARVLAELAPLL
jgi:kynurenine 3-monooxygenase